MKTAIAFLILALVAPVSAMAELPPIDFIAERLQLSRAPTKVELSITRLKNAPESFKGNVELFTGSAVSVGDLKISAESTDDGVRLLFVALFSTQVMTDLSTFGPIAQSENEVVVVDRELAYRYGTTTSISVSRESGELKQLTVKRKSGRWRAVVSKDETSVSGAVYKNGVVYLRFKGRLTPTR